MARTPGSFVSGAILSQTKRPLTVSSKSSSIDASNVAVFNVEVTGSNRSASTCGPAFATRSAIFWIRSIFFPNSVASAWSGLNRLSENVVLFTKGAAMLFARSS